MQKSVILAFALAVGGIGAAVACPGMAPATAPQLTLPPPLPAHDAVKEFEVTKARVLKREARQVECIRDATTQDELNDCTASPVMAPPMVTLPMVGSSCSQMRHAPVASLSPEDAGPLVLHALRSMGAASVASPAAKDPAAARKHSAAKH